ncbi:hypothetical protein MAM1_0014d01392 [Mucor ambiguus]|uniref:START domain-containing protein n=1 Tax=Mucor ambiguus TaxID=91626 RepID=A0A0C9LR49_9FUNG|nr:hypothetical protein MAM1_0014d01392 [Mucor ambiguus]
MKPNTVDEATTRTIKHASLQQQEQYYKHITSLAWQHHTSSSSKDEEDTHVDDKTHITTYKATQHFTPKIYNHTALEHYRACLSTIELRSQWCPWLTEIHVLESKKEHHTSTALLQGKIIDKEHVEHEMTWLEQTTLTKQSVRFIAASAALDFFFSIEIEHHCGDPDTTTITAATAARATMYLQWIKPTLVTPSLTLNRLIQLDAFAWISQCDQAVSVKKLDYDEINRCRIEYSYQQQQADMTSLPQAATAVDIHQKMNHPTRQWRHSGSWDPQQQQTVRKNKFLGSSSLLFTSSSSSATASPQLHPMTGNFSYPDKQLHPMMPWLTADNGDEDDAVLESEKERTKLYSLDKEELRVQVAYIPQITLALPEKLAWSDKFAQLCVRCYRRRRRCAPSGLQQQQQQDSYVIQILHPQHMMQYFEEKEEESMRLDDEEDELENEKMGMDPLLVSITISKSDVEKFRVNQNEWPIRPWTLTSEEEEEEEVDEKDVDKEEDDDIFVDGMEELAQESNVTNNMQAIASLPSSSTLIQTVAPPQKVKPKKKGENTATGDQSNTAPVMQLPLTTQKIPFVGIEDKRAKKTEPTLPDSNKIETQQEEQDIDVDEYRSLENKIPLSDPAALQKVAPLFNTYLQPPLTTTEATLVQSPSKENGYVLIKKIDIPNHPLGGFLSESTWKECSIWDIKAVLESSGARRVWDNTFESSTCLHALTPTSSLWHTKMKGTWPVSARDYVCFQGQYASPYRIDLLSTSCFGDSFQYKPLPQPVTGYTRATMDVMGWRLERLDEKTASVKQVMVTQFPTWVIQYITSRFIVQTCAAVQHARQYFEAFGAPPSLERLTCAQLVNVKHDHERKNWRCEYTRRLGASSSSDKDAPHETTAAVTADSGSAPQQSTVSIVRLDKRRWAANNNYAVAIDPPPSRVSALQKSSDPYGVWLTVEHDEAFIIPLRGKILVLIKPAADELPVRQHSQQPSDCTLNVNGNTITIDQEQRKPSLPTIIPDRSKQTSFSQNFLKEEEQEILSKMLPPDDHTQASLFSSNTTTNTTTTTTTSMPAEKHSNSTAAATATMSEEAKIEKALSQLPASPKEYAQAALSFLKLTDEQFGWTVLSDNNKTGIRISKKPGVKNTAAGSKSEGKKSAETTTTTSNNTILQVFDPYMVYKGSKVIEHFSVDEVRSVITDIGHIRALYDDTIEPKTDLIRQEEDDAFGCRVIRQTIKALFPFKNREIYAVSCVAQEELLTSISNTKRTLYVESSLPDFPLIHPKKTRGHLFMSGWILEPIDPYNTTTATNHPIPSTRVTHVAALDLGLSVPSYISNLVANNWFPKRLQAVESYLKSKGPPPVITLPFPLLVFSNNTLSKSVQQQDSNVEWIGIKSSYNEKHQFKVTNRFKILVEQKKPRPEEALQPTTSSSASLVPPFRRPIHHTLTPETRRGSLPTSSLPKKRTTASTSTEAAAATTTTTTTTVPPASTTTPSSTSTTHASTSVTYRALTCLQATFDLRPYAKGYEIQAQLYETTTQKIRSNISSKLELSISEPPLSNLLDGNKKNRKHTVTIQVVQGLSASCEYYELEFNLIPVREEVLNKRPTQLTVSHVLGEDQMEDGSWRGLMMVNDVEASVNSDIKLKALRHHDDETLEGSSSSISHLNSLGEKSSNHGDGSGSADSISILNDVSPVGGSEAMSGMREQSPFFEKTSGVPYQEDSSSQFAGGGGVVAAALGNVSAGVNNFGARMMNPFRAASNSFLLPNNNNSPSEFTTRDASSSDDDEDIGNSGTGHQGRKRRFTREEKHSINTTTMTMHEIRLLRKSSDTMRKGMLLLMICLGLAVVFALLMLQPMLERYYASFTVSSTVASLNQSIEQGVVRRLMQIPWFGEWDIQVIAVRRT